MYVSYSKRKSLIKLGCVLLYSGLSTANLLFYEHGVAVCCMLTLVIRSFVYHVNLVQCCISSWVRSLFSAFSETFSRIEALNSKLYISNVLQIMFPHKLRLCIALNETLERNYHISLLWLVLCQLQKGLVGYGERLPTNRTQFPMKKRHFSNQIYNLDVSFISK